MGNLNNKVEFTSHAPPPGSKFQITTFNKEVYEPDVVITPLPQDPTAKNTEKKACLVAKLGPARNLAKRKAKEAAFSNQIKKANLTQDFAGMLVSPSPKHCRTQGPVPTPHLGSGVPLVSPLPLEQTHHVFLKDSDTARH